MLRKKLRLENFDYSSKGYIYFLTICCANRNEHFGNETTAGFIKEAIEGNQNADILCYTIMPDHLHLVLSLEEKYKDDLISWVTAFKKYTSRITKDILSERLWQPDFYDHIIRNEESLEKIMEYTLLNPVRKGLVADWDEYPFSGGSLVK